MIVDRSATAMGDQHGLFRQRDDLAGHAPAGVADVHGDAEGIHLFHRFSAEVGDPGLFDRRHHPGAEGRGLVVAELHHPHAEVAEKLDAIELALQHAYAFEGEDDADAAGLLRQRELVGLAHLHEQVGVKFGQLLAEGDIAHGGFEAVVEAAQRRLAHAHPRLPREIERSLG
ncbi:MAG TPA: hypothetical protein VGL66_14290 [Caulobacteraceae bacterium]